MTRILVVEDDPSVRENVIEILQLEGFDAKGAADGQEGVAFALAEPFDLMICDVMMPILNGFEVLKLLRTHAETMTLPVVFLTAKTERESQREGMDKGGDDYITKPFTRLELLNSIKSRLSRTAYMDRKWLGKLKTIQNQAAFQLPVEFSGPLTYILSISEMLSTAEKDESILKVNQMGKAIHHSARALMETTQKYLFLADLEKRENLGTTSNDTCYQDAQELVQEVLVDMAGEYGRTVSFEGMDRFQCRLDEDDLVKLIEYLVSTVLGESQSDKPISVRGKAGDPTVGYQLELNYYEVEKKTADLMITAYHRQICERDWLMMQRITLLLGAIIQVDYHQDQKRVQISFPANQPEEK